MNCGKCGESTEPNERFCGNCGSSLETLGASTKAQASAPPTPAKPRGLVRTALRGLELIFVLVFPPFAVYWFFRGYRPPGSSYGTLGEGVIGLSFGTLILFLPMLRGVRHARWSTALLFGLACFALVLLCDRVWLPVWLFYVGWSLCILGAWLHAAGWKNRSHHAMR